MTETLRRKLLTALAELGERFPNWRFGQLVENAAGWADVSTWEIEDQQLLAVVRHYLDNQPEAAQRAC